MINFSVGLWIDTDNDSVADAPAGSISLNVGEDYFAYLSPTRTGIVAQGATNGDAHIIGTAGSDILTGSLGSDTLVGGSGDDYLMGRGSDGANDQLFGGAGNDHIQANNGVTIDGGTGDDDILCVASLSSSATILINGGQDADTISLTVAHTTTGSVNGGRGVDTLVVDAGDISGLALSGLERLIAGRNGPFLARPDQYMSFQYIEAVANGLELATPGAVNFSSSVPSALALWVGGSSGDDTITGRAFVDQFQGRGGNDRLNGGGGNDQLFGNQGNDTLDGGTGADLLAGHDGNDTYIVDDAGDSVDESGGATDIDTVVSSISFFLDLGYDAIENLTLSGLDAINGHGNNAANTIVGNANANSIAALGANDTVNGGAGRDTISGGTGNDILAGETGRDVLNGGSGSDILNGGRDADRLTGGVGRDTFVFDTPLDTGGIDTIVDFNPAEDVIRLSHEVFTALTVGRLHWTAFAAGSAAADASDRIIYDAQTGALSYDSDGSGGASAVQFAVLPTGLTLTAASFLVI